MGRTHQVGMEQVVGLFNVVQIAAYAVTHTANVVIGMVAYTVPRILDHPVNVGILAHIVAHHEEGGFDAVLRKQVKDAGRYFGNGPVVEREIDSLHIRIHTPEGVGIDVAEPVGRLFYEHLFRKLR